MNVLKRYLTPFALLCVFNAKVIAGGSGLNVVVVVNQSSTNSIELANFYCEQRHIPPQNVLRTTWTGANVFWSRAEYESVVLNPLLTMLADRQLTNQVDYVVLSMDFPYEINDGGTLNSTTSALFYGFKQDFPADPVYDPASCNLPPASTNSYSGSEGIFRATPPTAPGSNSFLVTLLTSSSLVQAEALILRGIASDRTHPVQPAFLAHTTDIFRNVRYEAFDNAIFNTRVSGDLTLVQTNMDSPLGLSNLLGLATGLYQFTVSPNTFVPGAMADSLTSFGGVIFGNNDQTTLFAFLDAGATAGYGTVTEPCNYEEKFPSPQAYFYQARGFNLAESYYQSLTNPYQGLIVGEPLAAPFAQRPVVTWANLPSNSVLAGLTNLLVIANPSDAWHPVQQVDLFVDGIFLQTLTNVSPVAGNVLSVTLNGVTTNYVVTAGATIKSLASALADAINTPAYASVAKVEASAHGDRLELRSTDLNKSGSQVSLLATASIGSGLAENTFLTSSRSSFLDTAARGTRAYYFTNIPNSGDFLQLIAVKTNGQTVVVTVTNTVGGTTIGQLGKSLFSAVSNTPSLQGSDGIFFEDVVMHEDYAYAFGAGDHAGDYNIRPRSVGWPAAQVQVCVRGSQGLTFSPTGTNQLTARVGDLEPRNHLYVRAGATNLPIGFGLNSAQFADGFHELTAVAYEGTHVRSQGQASQVVKMQNTTLSATFITLYGGSNTALGATLQFLVTANTNNISSIELYSTGGLLASVIGQVAGNFSVSTTNLGVGLHPFYAVVTSSIGTQYRTETKWIRIVAQDLPFLATITQPPPRLVWPATVGRTYDIQVTTNLGLTFQMLDSVTPSNSPALWTDTNTTIPQRFYRIRGEQ